MAKTFGQKLKNDYLYIVIKRYLTPTEGADFNNVIKEYF